jgi:hypothetical protein
VSVSGIFNWHLYSSLAVIIQLQLVFKLVICEQEDISHLSL